MSKNKFLIIGSVLAVVVFVGVIIFINNKKTITYNIIFDTDGGSLVETQIVKKNEQVKKPSDPAKEGYTFLEWTYQEKTYDFSQGVISDLKLSAKWLKKDETIETFVVKFDSDGGTTISNQVIEKDKKVEKPSDPVKEGYTFKGWFLNDELYDFEKNVDGNIELKALWEKIEEEKKTNSNNNISGNNNNTNNTNNNNTNNNNNNNNNATTTPTVKKYTVTFNSNGGTAVSSQTVEVGKTASKPGNPSKGGYDFVEWQLNGNTFYFNSPINGDITLTAIWKNQIWDIDSSTRSIVKYKGNDSNVVIPSVIDGVTINKINSNAFASSSLQSVTVPSSISVIEGSAFLKSVNKNLTEVFVKDGLWKNTNWNSVFGTSGSAYVTGDSGVLIRSAYKMDGCNMLAFSGTCAVSYFVHVSNSDGIYPIYYDIRECWKLHGGTGILSVEIPYYTTADSFTLYRPGYSNFKGWIGDNGDTPEKVVVIPKGSRGERHYTAVCEDD